MKGIELYSENTINVSELHFRTSYLERTFHHFVGSFTVEQGGTGSDAMKQSFSMLLIPGLQSYGFGVLLMEVPPSLCVC